MSRKQLENWLQAYGKAWETRDPDAAAELFSDDATYQETPFVKPICGKGEIRKYWEHVARTQEDIHFEFEILAISKTGCFARWRSTFLRLHYMYRLELDGIFLLTFDADRHCTSLREWWHRKEIGRGRKRS